MEMTMDNSVRPQILPPLRGSHSTSIINIVEYWISMAQNKNSRSSVASTQSTILEQGGNFFFYRLKVRSEKHRVPMYL
jgi:hypothetical protein